MKAVLLFALSLVLIVTASELFTNAVEWTGFRLHIASGATGSLLAALGTALPETVVPVVALISRQPTSDAVATGAILGAPFLLITLGVGVTGFAVMSRRAIPVLQINPPQVRRDLGTFLLGFALLIVSVWLPHWVRIIVAIGLLGIYARYVSATLRGGSPTEEMPEPLHLVRWLDGQPHLALIIVQLTLAVAMLIIGADLFVAALGITAQTLHIPALVLSIVLVPLATELPETLNSVLWVRSNDDGLAFGNVAGATAFQVCIPGAIGLTFTSWHPGTAGLLSAVATGITGTIVFLALHDGHASGKTLALAILPWLAYVALVPILGSAAIH